MSKGETRLSLAVVPKMKLRRGVSEKGRRARRGLSSGFSRARPEINVRSPELHKKTHILASLATEATNGGETTRNIECLESSRQLMKLLNASPTRESRLQLLKRRRQPSSAWPQSLKTAGRRREKGHDCQFHSSGSEAREKGSHDTSRSCWMRESCRRPRNSAGSKP